MRVNAPLSKDGELLKRAMDQPDEEFPMNEQTAVAVHRQDRALTASDMRAQVNLVQEVMRAVMIGPSKENKDGVHYGVVPGTQKPTLFKPGAEVLCATFRIAPSYRIEDLSTEDYSRYRIVCIGTHQTTSIFLGEGVGSCSSNEEKYKWRKATNKEWEMTTENRRRIKYGYNSKEQREYEIKQVRTEAADLDNTILKMAAKRAQVAMTLNVTAASDIFTQDIEDLPEELRPDDAPAIVGPQPYSDEDFKADLPKFQKLIETGKKTPEQIIIMVSSKVIPSEAQKAAIRAIKEPVVDPDFVAEMEAGK
jgi:hypothetical protein